MVIENSPVHLSRKDLHVLWNFPTKPHIPTLDPPAVFVLSHCAHFLFFQQPVHKLSSDIQTDQNVVYILYSPNESSLFLILISIRSRLPREQRCQHQEDRQGGPGEQSLHLLSSSWKNILGSASDQSTVCWWDNEDKFIVLVTYTCISPDYVWNYLKN